ncbi:hypothetical protein OUZ56_020892 [Daphnia magna]|uniref:Uncharacterized protein n=1 Tax=Daphnia magna TaxID=35525 RepID=A0ABQ9ZFX0_9CRUS|nr:hypothetical protein OUZ56_020892 [Daphnia magna]
MELPNMAGGSTGYISVKYLHYGIFYYKSSKNPFLDEGFCVRELSNQRPRPDARNVADEDSVWYYR